MPSWPSTAPTVPCSGSRLLGSAGDDRSQDVGVDAAGNVYIAGFTNGVFSGTTVNADYDAYVAKFDKNGHLKWTKRLHTDADDEFNALDLDAAGNVYVAGFTKGDVAGTNAGGADMIVASYDPSGTKRWIDQRGTAPTGTSAGNDVATDIIADQYGEVIAVGATEGHLATSTSSPHYGKTDAFMALYDTSGTLKRIEQYGTNEVDSATSVAMAGGIIIAGHTQGSMDGSTNAGGDDLFVKRVTNGGWTMQKGSAGNDWVEDLAVDSAGHLYATGFTAGNLAGHTTPTGTKDTFVLPIDSTNGTLASSAKFVSSPGSIHAFGVAVDANLYVGGVTTGDLGSASRPGGYSDAFVYRVP